MGIPPLPRKRVAGWQARWFLLGRTELQGDAPLVDQLVEALRGRVEDLEAVGGHLQDRQALRTNELEQPRLDSNRTLKGDIRKVAN